MAKKKSEAKSSEPNVQNEDNKKARYLVLDRNEKIIATLIDRDLAEQWVKERKQGARSFRTKILD